MVSYYEPPPSLVGTNSVIRDDGALVANNSGAWWTEYQTWLQTAGNTVQPWSAYVPPPPPVLPYPMPPGWPPPLGNQTGT